MKNILNYKYVLVLTILLSLVSCMDDDQDYTAANKPVATMTTSSSFEITEGESATITLEINRAISTSSDFKIDLISGGDLNDVNIDGAHLDEYEIGPEGFQVTIPSYQTSVTFDLEAVREIYPEPTEVLNFRITQGSAGNSLVSNEEIFFTVTINNYATQETAMELEWDDEPVDDYNLCDVDFDIYLDSFGAYAFTGDCPEYLMDPINPSALWTTVLADGTHNIIVDLYSMNSVLEDVEDTELVVEIPLRLKIGKVGTFLVDLNLNGLYNTESQDSANGTGGELLVGWIEVIGGLYSVYNANGELVGQESI